MNRNPIQTRIADERDLVEPVPSSIFERILRVYDHSEGNLMKVLGQRTTLEEVQSLIQKRQLILAELGGEIVGSVMLIPIDSTVAEFGMLVADLQYRGLGIGSALVRQCEEVARERKFTTMQLRLVVPRHTEHPDKEFLKRWYSRLGYRHFDVQRPEACHTQLRNNLAVECDVLVWQKPITR